MKSSKLLKYAVIIPVYNEELTIGNVLDELLLLIPYADIFVINNNSTDKTFEIVNKYTKNSKVKIHQVLNSI
jgi:glycosyltransferase involved in cell wall biosynthesis